jgi:hypothetical protein
VICGAGVIDVVRRKDAHNYEHEDEIRTVRGARTGLFVQSRDSLFVAMRAHVGGPAEIRVFAAR